MRTAHWHSAHLGDETGNITLLIALVLPVMLAIVGLALDAGYMLDYHQQMGAAADAAAVSGAFEVHDNSSITSSSLASYARDDASRNGFLDGQNGTSVAITRGDWSNYTFTSDSAGTYVQAVVSRSVPTFFMPILGTSSVDVGATAVAGVAGNPKACVILSQDLTIGNSTMTLNGCGVGVGGNLDGSNPNATITGTPTPSVAVAGSCSGTCSNMGNLTTGASSPVDPLAGLAAPSNPGGCTAGTSATLGPGCYTSISSAVTTLSTGTYYVTGTVDIGDLTGNNVMIYLTGGGNLTSGNNKAIHLTAPSTGTYTGIAIFQDPSDTNNFGTGNHFTLDVSGAIYMPGADVDIANHLTFTSESCTLFIAQSLSIANGSGSLSNSGCASSFGGAAFLTVSLVQ